MNEYTFNLDDNNYLAHFGVEGMHWGIRRYQNPDGTLTALGRQRYGSDNEEYTSAHQKRSVRSMSTKEIQDANKRLQAEEQYKKLTDSQVKKIITGAAVGALSGILVSQLTKRGNKAFDSGFEWLKNHPIEDGIKIMSQKEYFGHGLALS